MPKYDYKCPQCSRIEEVEHSMDDTPVIDCAFCHKPCRKVFNPTPSVFKGTGWAKLTEYKAKKST